MATPLYVHLLHNSLRQLDWCNVARVTIDMIPDVALLEIFDFYVGEDWIYYVIKEQINAWHTLVHVCQKWRNTVFGSPLRLNLQLYCRHGTPVRKTLSVWPPFPIVIEASGNGTWGVDNIVAALEHSDRICRLKLITFTSSQFEILWGAMSQQPFPALTDLNIQKNDHETAPVIPASFLSGSAPRLRRFTLFSVPFPGLPKLLLSTTHLVDLTLAGIPHSGYISPEAMVTCLFALTRLESLFLKFQSPRSRPHPRSRRPPPQIRTPLPVLTKLVFIGVSEYLEDLVALIEAPLLDNLAINFFHQLIFDTLQLTGLISRTPKFKAHDEARIVFSGWDASVKLPRAPGGELSWGVSCRQTDWQLSSLAQACSSTFPQPLISTVEHLHLYTSLRKPDLQDDIEISQWLELLHSFPAVKNLYITREIAPFIAPTLKEFAGGRVAEVLPALQTLFLEDEDNNEPPLSGAVQDMIGQFVTARQLERSRWKTKDVYG